MARPKINRKKEGTRTGKRTGARTGTRTGARTGRRTGARTGRRTGARTGRRTGARTGKRTGKRTKKHRGGAHDEDAEVCSMCGSSDDIAAMCVRNHRICQSCLDKKVATNRCLHCRLTVLYDGRDADKPPKATKAAVEDALLQELRDASVRYSLVASRKNKGILSSITRLFGK